MLGNKLLGKVPGPCNPKEHYLSFRRKKNTKSLTQSKIITYHYIKSIITEHPKTSLKLPKSIRQCKKVGSHSPLYCDTKKWNFFKPKKCKNNKKSTCF